jgi:hypothetical protein
VVAERVVDVLEVVQVDHHQRGLAAAGAQVAHRMGEGQAHVVAVGQAGQRVVHRQVAGLGLALLEQRHIGLAHQQRVGAGHRVAAAARRQLVPAHAAHGVHRQRQRGQALVARAVHELGELLRVGHALLQRLLRRAHRLARGRVAVQRLAVDAVQRDHHRGVQQRLHRAQRLGRVADHGAALAQHRHAAVGQAMPAEGDVQRHRLAVRVQGPLLVEHGAVVDEVGLVLRKAPRHRLGHVLAHVAAAQLLQRRRAPHLQRGAVAPVHAAQVDVEDPHRVAHQVERAVDLVLARDARQRALQGGGHGGGGGPAVRAR